MFGVVPHPVMQDTLLIDSRVRGEEEVHTNLLLCFLKVHPDPLTASTIVGSMFEYVRQSTVPFTVDHADGDGRRSTAERDAATISAAKTADLKKLLEPLKPVWCTIRLFCTKKSTGVVYSMCVSPTQSDLNRCVDTAPMIL